MIAYKLEYALTDYQEVLEETLVDWSKADHDVYIVSEEGHKIFTNKILLNFYSNTLGPVFDSLVPSTSPAGISVPTSSSSITNLFKILTTGQTASNNKETLENVTEAAQYLGISLQNCILESKKIPGKVTIRKLPFKNESKEQNLDVSQTIFSLPSRKWNTSITARNRITDVSGGIEDNAEVTCDENSTSFNRKNENEFACDLCPKVFSAKKNVKRHKLEKHSSEDQITGAPYVKVEGRLQCDHCESEFDSDYKLKKHSLQHTNRFECDECNKCFQSSSTLRNHKNIHLDVKPYKCDICDKEFTQAGNLKTHNVRHHGSTDPNPNTSTTTIDASEISETNE